MKNNNPLKLLVDSNLSMALMANLHGVSADAHSIWSIIESKSKIYRPFITDIGLDKNIEILKKVIHTDEEFQEIINALKNNLEVIKVTDKDIQHAKQMSLISSDFESAIELACAKSHGINIILTDCANSFAFKELNESFGKRQTVSIKSPHSLGMTSELSAKQIQEEEYNIIQNGGEDWGNWGESFDRIENRIEFVNRVLEYHHSCDDYFALKNIWMSLNRFTDLYSYWEFRLKWLNIISQLAKSNYDTNYYFVTLTSIAWTYTMQARFLEAEEKLNLAYKLIDKIDNDNTIKFMFYHCLFVHKTHSSVCHRNNQCGLEAEEILCHQKRTLELIDVSKESIDIRKKQRLYINYLRNCAKFHYISEEALAAKEIYIEVIKRSKEINWIRGVSYAHNRLADIYIDAAIECQSRYDDDGKLENILEAKNHIELGKKIAEINKNKRRLSGYYLSEARILKLCNKETEYIKEKIDLAKENAVPAQDKLIEHTEEELLLK